MKKVQCICNSVASPFYSENGIYTVIDEVSFGEVKYFRIRFDEEFMDDCLADDFVLLEEEKPDVFFISTRSSHSA